MICFGVWKTKKCTALMALDLSAAFDRVDHTVFLSVLEHQFGIQADVLSWFESYLNPRYCKVNVGKEYSDVMEFRFSVPQGSCAGPTLFSAYASTFPQVKDESLGIHGFADDHVVNKDFETGPEESDTFGSDTIGLIEENAKLINMWMDKNRLKMNQSKTEFIIFGSCQQVNKCVSDSLDVNGVRVPRSDQINYLGASLDSLVNLKNHI